MKEGRGGKSEQKILHIEDQLRNSKSDQQKVQKKKELRKERQRNYHNNTRELYRAS